ncbi:aminotransferase class I/II-fold pyridoxal phosphate-dependent enzyme [Umezawaea sp. NPDC059074]|uniref:aminotransferase class I/II-fold pyridoxal phosphate-dependent enzyme n=1 Tax=Umezawaea sp. NPDC059074 TaxID=3346716 RepID=UPI0036A1C875
MTDRAGPSSHEWFWHPDVVQAVSPRGVLDLGPGYLEPGLLPVDLLREGYSRALAEYGSAALTYGTNAGAVPLREALAARVAAADGVPCGPDHVLVTAGTSYGLNVLATTTAVAGQVVFVDETSYDFGRRIFTDHGLVTREVPSDSEGMDPHALRAGVDRERAAGREPGFVYLTPTFHNPTGRLVGAVRRRELVETAADLGVLVVEDDAYAELDLDGGELPRSLGGLADHEGVVRFGTFSKTVGPGLRLGWMVAHPAVVARFADRGLLVSGGSANHVTSLAVEELIRGGDYDRHLGWLRDRLRERRDALVEAVAVEFGDRVEFTAPRGGFFAWLVFPGDSEAVVLAAAERAGVQVAAGSRFGSATNAVRLAYSFNPPEALAAAVTRLAAAMPAHAHHSSRS